MTDLSPDQSDQPADPSPTPQPIGPPAHPGQPMDPGPNAYPGQPNWPGSAPPGFFAPPPDPGPPGHPPAGYPYPSGYPATGRPGAVGPRRPRIGLMIGAVVGVLVLGLCGAGAVSLAGQSLNPPAPRPTVSVIELQVVGTGLVQIYYSVNIDSAQALHTVPWSMTFHGAKGTDVFLSAIPTSGGGEATCRVLIQGIVIVEESSSSSQPARCSLTV
jgi:hypothetical protein